MIHEYRKAMPPLRGFPSVVLTTDNWNDYGYHTLYHAVLYVSASESVELGAVKIMGRESRDPVPPLAEHGEHGEALPDGYCSLGQEYSYYELLAARGEDIYDPYLRALRDVVYLPEVRSQFEDEAAFHVSLLREGRAKRALEDAPSLFSGEQRQRIEINVDFETGVGGQEFLFPLTFGNDQRLPSRINAIIGYNGTGKTTLLANLAHVANADASARQTTRIANYGRLVSDTPLDFSVVISVSYSAFDTFKLPRSGDADRMYPHVYCGLRRSGGGGSETLKTQDELAAEFVTAMSIARNKERGDRLTNAFEPISREASFGLTDLRGFLTLDEEDVRSVFDQLSTGHKIILLIAVQLVANLQPGSLVLIDEPESHLHPPLLAALLRSLTATLDDFDSFSVIATHSPVVLQEVPSKYVRILRRYGDRTAVEAPEIETFGENVGLLTRHVFSLDSSQSDWQGVIRDLAEAGSAEYVESLFPTGLSAQARLLLNSLQHRR